MSESVRDVCMSHQSDWIYYKQPIKFLVLKSNNEESKGLQCFGRKAKVFSRKSIPFHCIHSKSLVS